LRRPIGNVTQVPALDCTDVASGVGTKLVVPLQVEADTLVGVPNPTTASTAHDRAVTMLRRPTRWPNAFMSRCSRS
jgi:hypothetical protein